MSRVVRTSVNIPSSVDSESIVPEEDNDRDVRGSQKVNEEVSGKVHLTVVLEKVQTLLRRLSCEASKSYIVNP